MAHMPWNWIVVAGYLIDTIDGGGGFEFIGPFPNEEAAIRYGDRIRSLADEGPGRLVLAVELLAPGDWKDRS
jgi:hypothetical protein